jgi:hypothetical protein
MAEDVGIAPTTGQTRIVAVRKDLSRRYPRLCRTSSSVGGGSEIRTRDGVNHTCFPGKLLVYPDSLLPLN